MYNNLATKVQVHRNSDLGSYYLKNVVRASPTTFLLKKVHKHIMFIYCFGQALYSLFALRNTSD
jgi:hypothetical protein